MRLVIVSGLSGSGKSVALNVLEDAGFTMEKKDLDLHQVRVGLRYSIW